MKDVFAVRSSELSLKCCARPFSFFFDLIRPLWHGANVNPMHRICSLMRKMGVQSVLLEELEPYHEIEAEAVAASVRLDGKVTPTAYRINFFRTPESSEWRTIPADHFLGYAVVLTLTFPDGSSQTYILEAVTRVPTMWLPAPNSETTSTVTNYYVHCSRPFATTVGVRGDSREFQFIGTFFCQQNNLTHVCAHAALRTAINSSPSIRAKLTNSKINELLGIDHVKQKVGSESSTGGCDGRGLSSAQIATVAEHMDFTVQFGDFTSYPEIAYADFIYPLIESGHPTVLAMYAGTVGHAIAVLGHTVNSDRWTPEARRGYGAPPITEYIGASAWADHLIIADDNFGMYVTVPSDALKALPQDPSTGKILIPPKEPNLYALLAIGLLPKGVETTGFETEQTTSYVARHLIDLLPSAGNKWLEVLSQKNTHPLVCRTLLQSRESYVAAMTAATDADGTALAEDELAMLGALPDRFWVTEITIPNLLAANKRKLGDILASCLPASSGNRIDEIIFAWLPGFRWCGPAYGHPPEGTEPVDAWKLRSHFPILRGSGQARPLFEW
jgi:hypothetical protein